MPLREIFDRFWASPPPRFREHELSDVQSRLVPRESYVHITLERMHLRQGRRLWTSRRPVLHSFVMADVPGGRYEVPMVAGPGALEQLSDGEGDRVVIGRLSLLGPTPFVGGDLEMTCGLFTVTARDFAGDLLNLASSVSSAIGVEPVGAALKLVDPIKRGLEQLLGASDAELVLGLRRSLRGNDGASPATGYLVLAGESIEPGSRLSVAADGRLLDAESSAEVDDDYFVLRVGSLDRRDDWQAMAELHVAWEEASRAAVAGEKERLGRATAAFAQVVVSSSQLIESDQVRLILALRQRIAALAAQPHDEAGLLVAGAAGGSAAINSYLVNAPEPAEARSIGVHGALASL
jgi:hypothetical protein